MGSILDKLYEREKENRATEIQKKQEEARAGMSIRDNAGSTHQVRAILITDGTIHVWSKTWKGMHIIGRDCEFVKP